MTYPVWLDLCDKLAALWTGGMMTEDLDFDWRSAWEWGEDPGDAVAAAIVHGAEGVV